jgi:ribose transport system permease protein
VNSLVERLKAVGSNQQAMLLFVLLAMVAFFTSQNPIFFSNAVFGNIISDWSPIVLIAVGQAFVIISGGIDLSVGSTVAIAGVVAAFAIRALTENGQSPTVTLSLGVLIAALTGLVVGAINAFLITKANMVPFIATLVTMGAGAGLAIVLTGGGPIGGGPDAAIQLSVAKVGPFSYPGLAIVLAGIPVYFLMNKNKS